MTQTFKIESGDRYFYENQVTGEPSLQFSRPAGKGLVFFAVGETQTAKRDFSFGIYGQEFDVRKGDKITLVRRGSLTVTNLFKIEREEADRTGF